MGDFEEALAQLETLAPTKVLYSSYTKKWYVSSEIEIADGTFLRSGSPHRETPQLAVIGYFEDLKNLSENEYIVTQFPNVEWAWTGEKFEVTDRGVKLQIEYQKKYVAQCQDRVKDAQAQLTKAQFRLFALETSNSLNEVNDKVKVAIEAQDKLEETLTTISEQFTDVHNPELCWSGFNHLCECTCRMCKEA